MKWNGQGKRSFTAGVRALGLALAAAAALGAQSKATLDTKVTGEGNLVFLEWGKKHPWAERLASQGPTLLGEYRAMARPDQVAAECFASMGANRAAARGRRPRGRALPCSGIPGTPVGGEKGRTLRYELPDALTATPQGPVCLFFRMPDGKILPIRSATRRGEDTARFRLSAWDQAAAKRTAARTLSRNVQKLREDVAVSQGNIEARRAVNEEKGWSSLEQCQQYSAPEIEVDGEERPVAEPDKQDGVARLVCISRVHSAARSGEDRDGPVTKESMLDPILLALGVVPPPAMLLALDARFGESGPIDTILSAERKQQFVQYRSDWEQLSGLVDDYEKLFRRPHFGAFREPLDLQSITEGVGKCIWKALRAEKPLQPRQVAGYVGGSLEAEAYTRCAADGKAQLDTSYRRSVAGYIGGSLEAYTRCVADGKAQLDTSYRRSVELRESTPELQQRIRQELVASCQAGVNKLTELEATHQQLLQQLAREQTALTAAQAAGGIPSSTQDLNSVACAP